jgi:hypothetical protein
MSDEKPKVVELFSRRPVTAPPTVEPAQPVNPGLVKALEDLLESVKAGRVQGALFTAFYPDANDWFEFISGAPAELNERFVARLEVMKQVIVDELNTPTHTGEYPDADA